MESAECLMYLCTDGNTLVKCNEQSGSLIALIVGFVEKARSLPLSIINAKGMAKAISVLLVIFYARTMMFASLFHPALHHAFSTVLYSY